MLLDKINFLFLYNLSVLYYDKLVFFNKTWKKFKYLPTNLLKLKSFVGWQHIQYQRQRHFFHIVSPSPWPIYTSFSLLAFLISFVQILHDFNTNVFLLLFFFILFLSCLWFWFSDIIIESQTQHTILVQKAILFAFVLFISSEVMFFASFFWAFFHSSLAPSIWIFCTWPPLGIVTIPAFELPLLNTLILLSSGFTVTWAHKALIDGIKSYFLFGLFLTILLASLFMFIQFIEYRFAPFSIYDGIYGSCFFMLTGFHGFHVFLGGLMLIVCFFRGYLNNFSKGNHLGFITSAWYWHFVDVVWIFLFIFVYWWGNTLIFENSIELTQNIILSNLVNNNI